MHLYAHKHTEEKHVGMLAANEIQQEDAQHNQLIKIAGVDKFVR